MVFTTLTLDSFGGSAIFGMASPEHFRRRFFGWLYHECMGTSLTITTDSDLKLGKVVRESLHLEDGDRVLIEPDGDGLVVRREADSPRIYKENGHWVFSAGEPSNYSIRDVIDDVRNERIRKFGGE